MIAVGGYDNSTMGEDMELVVRLHEFSRMNRKPYKIDFAQDAICWSQTPEKLSELGKQRKRWQRGLFQCMWGHRKNAGKPTVRSCRTFILSLFSALRIIVTIY